MLFLQECMKIKGHYSSDLPYLENNPEKFIGLLVEEKFKYRWRLF